MEPAKKLQTTHEGRRTRSLLDLEKIIAELRRARDEVVTAIAQLEALADQPSITNLRSGTKSPRGRKNMGEEERQVVSERMRRYWEKRRKSSPPRGQ